MGMKPHGESVIARLMCFDEQPPHRPVHEQQKVLSENYLLKTASIGLREGSLFSNVFSRRATGGQPMGSSNTFEHQVSKNENGKQSINGKSSNLSTENVHDEVLKLLPGSRSKNGDIFGNKSKWNYKGNVPTSLRKVENDSLAGHSSPRISVLKFIPTKGTKDVRCIRFHPHPRPGNRDHGVFLKAGSGKIHNELTCEEQVSNIKKTLIHSFNACDVDRSSKSSEFEDFSETFQNPLSLSQAEAEMTGEKDVLGSPGSMADEKHKLQLAPGVDICNDGYISQSSMNSGLSSCNFSCVSIDNDNPEASDEVFQSTMDNRYEKSNRGGDIENVPRVSELSTGNVASQSRLDEKLANRGISSGIFEGKNFEPNPSIHSVIDPLYSDVWKALSRQESANQFFEDQSHKTFKGTHEYSPDSVLSPHEINSSTSECFESIATDFDSDFKSEESHTEGSWMAISKDEDMKKDFNDLSKDVTNLQWLFEYEETRDFSYLLDLLDEAGFNGVDLVDFGRIFDSQEYLISPLVFKALEKKYGKQTSWRKSDRKLLFDRINYGLEDIITVPLINFESYTMPVRRRFSMKLNRHEAEEELWQLLNSEVKVKSKDLSEKALGKEMKWFELDEEVEFIVRELGSFLLDELVVEFCVHC